jgi:hypothetical protein
MQPFKFQPSKTFFLIARRVLSSSVDLLSNKAILKPLPERFPASLNPAGPPPIITTSNVPV